MWIKKINFKENQETRNNYQIHFIFLFLFFKKQETETETIIKHITVSYSKKRRNRKSRTENKEQETWNENVTKQALRFWYIHSTAFVCALVEFILYLWIDKLWVFWSHSFIIIDAHKKPSSHPSFYISIRLNKYYSDFLNPPLLFHSDLP